MRNRFAPVTIALALALSAAACSDDGETVVDTDPGADVVTDAENLVEEGELPTDDDEMDEMEDDEMEDDG